MTSMAEKFNPKQHITKIKGKDYLEVKWRIVWFREEHPSWGIDTTLSECGGVMFTKTVITDDDGKIIATGMATVRAASSNRESWAGREIEKAETASEGRALVAAGYGTQFTDDFDEGDYLADSPVTRQPLPRARSNPRETSPSSTNNQTPEKGTRKTVTITHRETKSAKNGKPMIVMDTSSGDKLFLFTRQIFMDKGYCTGMDWTTIGEREPFNISCDVVADENGYWQIDESTVPAFNPDWDAFGHEDIPL
jgi:hypothetical protein